MLLALQAEKLKNSSSSIGGPFKDRLAPIIQEEANQEKFLRKMLAAHVKGIALQDLVSENLNPQVLDGFESLDQLKVHCTSIGLALTASRQLTDTVNLSLAKEWAAAKSKIRCKLTQGVQPEELRTQMREADLWTEGLWSDSQKEEFIEKARSLDATRSFKVAPNPSFKRKENPQRTRFTNKAQATKNVNQGVKGNIPGHMVGYGRGKLPKFQRGPSYYGARRQTGHTAQQSQEVQLPPQPYPGPSNFPWSTMQQTLPHYPPPNYAAPQNQLFGYTPTSLEHQAGRSNNNYRSSFRGGRGNGSKRAKPNKNNTQF